MHKWVLYYPEVIFYYWVMIKMLEIHISYTLGIAGLNTEQNFNHLFSSFWRASFLHEAQERLDVSEELSHSPPLCIGIRGWRHRWLKSRAASGCCPGTLSYPRSGPGSLKEKTPDARTQWCKAAKPLQLRAARLRGRWADVTITWRFHQQSCFQRGLGENSGVTFAMPYA